MARVFISYSRDSEAIVRGLADDIAAMGDTVWFDQDLSGGHAWWNQILARTRDCDVFVFALHPAALSSTACKREYTYAAQLGKPILPVLISDEVSTSLLPPALMEIQFVDYRNPDRAAALALARALKDVPEAAPLPDPLPEPPEVPISYLGGLAEKVEVTSSLSFDEQSSLVLELKRSMRDPATTKDARTLLVALRVRRDLFATIAEEIEEVLASVEEAKPASGERPATGQVAQPERRQDSEPERRRQQHHVRAAMQTKPQVEEGEREKAAAREPDRPQAKTASSAQRQRKASMSEERQHQAATEFSELSVKSRIVGAAGLGGIGAIGAMLMTVTATAQFFVPVAYTWSVILFLSGALAGAIIGTRRRMTPALLGMGAAACYVLFVTQPGLTATILVFSLSPLGALLSLFLARFEGQAETVLKPAIQARILAACLLGGFGIVAATIATLFSRAAGDDLQFLMQNPSDIRFLFEEVSEVSAIGNKPLFLVLSSVIAGALAGISKSRMIASLPGLGGALLLFLVAGGRWIEIAVLLLAPVGTSTGIYLERRQNRV